MRFRLLGAVEIAVGERTLPPPRRRERCLLGILLLELDRVVLVDRLADLLWEGGPPARARRIIHGHVSRLRALLATAVDQPGGPAVELTTVGAGYRLRTDPSAVDVHRFRALLAEAAEIEEQHDRIDRLQAALALWRGPPLAGAAGDWLRHRLCADLTEQHLAAVEDLIAAKLALRREREVLPQLARLTATHPYREALTGLHMRALYQDGRRTEALTAYGHLREQLATDLGIDPGPAVRELHQAILRGELAVPNGGSPASGGDPTRSGEHPATPPPAPVVVPRQLPAGDRSFTGRTTELAQPARGVAAIPAVSLLLAVEVLVRAGRAHARRDTDRQPEADIPTADMPQPPADTTTDVRSRTSAPHRASSRTSEGTSQPARKADIPAVICAHCAGRSEASPEERRLPVDCLSSGPLSTFSQRKCKHVHGRHGLRLDPAVRLPPPSFVDASGERRRVARKHRPGFGPVGQEHVE